MYIEISNIKLLGWLISQFILICFGIGGNSRRKIEFRNIEFNKCSSLNIYPRKSCYNYRSY